MPVNELDVFVNCPFDPEYKEMFNAIVFTIVRSGYRARCALETDNAAENRLSKICGIISECKFGVHDISRTELTGPLQLPRFNMPLELGLFFGAQRYGNRQQKTKACIVFDTLPFRFQSFISDISGQDIHHHGGKVTDLITKLSTWLRHLPGGQHAGGGKAIYEEYQLFETIVPVICEGKKLLIAELSFQDYNQMATEFVRTLTKEPVAAIAPTPATGFA